MTDIIFINDIDDYNAYKKLKPVNTYKYKKVQFICRQCGKKSLKTFRKLTLEFLCSHCTQSNASIIANTKRKQTCLEKYGTEYYLQTNDSKEKRKQTCLEKYGTTTYSQTDECKEKFKHTILDRYGVTNPSMLPDIQNKKKQTCLIKYNKEYYSQTDEFKDRCKTTNINKYGVEHYSQTDEFKTYYKQYCRDKYLVDNVFQLNSIKNKIKQVCLEKYGTEYYLQSNTRKEKHKLYYINLLNKKLISLHLQLMERSDTTSIILCNNCNHTFKFANNYVIQLLNHYKSNFCPICSRIIPSGKSLKEKEVLTYLKTIYNGLILENVRYIIKPYELDMYLQDLNLGIEFDGTYWHADKRFYSENDLIGGKQLLAKDIWEKDYQKDLLCKQNNIKLYRIKEYDWDNNQSIIQYELKKLIGE